MDCSFKIPNGLPIYLFGKLVNDFDPIFCQVCKDSVRFLGARDHLSVILKISANPQCDSKYASNLNISYAFDNTNELKTNINWFRTKSNARKNIMLKISPHEDLLQLSNRNVKAELRSFIKDPPIPIIPEMNEGICVKIIDLKEMANQVRSIKGEVVKLKYYKNKLEMNGVEYELPIYKIPTQNPLFMMEEDDEENKTTYCLKQMLLISSQLASEFEPNSAELRFYPGGALQLNSRGNYLSILCLMTTVKI